MASIAFRNCLLRVRSACTVASPTCVQKRNLSSRSIGAVATELSDADILHLAKLSHLKFVPGTKEFDTVKAAVSDFINVVANLEVREKLLLQHC
jgi:hypothetical protein